MRKIHFFPQNLFSRRQAPAYTSYPKHMPPIDMLPRPGAARLPAWANEMGMGRFEQKGLLKPFRLSLSPIRRALLLTSFRAPRYQKSRPARARQALCLSR